MSKSNISPEERKRATLATAFAVIQMHDATNLHRVLEAYLAPQDQIKAGNQPASNHWTKTDMFELATASIEEGHTATTQYLLENGYYEPEQEAILTEKLWEAGSSDLIETLAQTITKTTPVNNIASEPLTSESLRKALFQSKVDAALTMVGSNDDDSTKIQASLFHYLGEDGISADDRIALLAAYIANTSMTKYFLKNIDAGNTNEEQKDLLVSIVEQANNLEILKICADSGIDDRFQGLLVDRIEGMDIGARIESLAAAIEANNYDLTEYLLTHIDPADAKTNEQESIINALKINQDPRFLKLVGYAIPGFKDHDFHIIDSILKEHALGVTKHIRSSTDNESELKGLLAPYLDIGIPRELQEKHLRNFAEIAVETAATTKRMSELNLLLKTWAPESAAEGVGYTIPTSVKNKLYFSNDGKLRSLSVDLSDKTDTSAFALKNRIEQIEALIAESGSENLAYLYYPLRALDIDAKLHTKRVATVAVPAPELDLIEIQNLVSITSAAILSGREHIAKILLEKGFFTTDEMNGLIDDILRSGHTDYLPESKNHLLDLALEELVTRSKNEIAAGRDKASINESLEPYLSEFTIEQLTTLAGATIKHQNQELTELLLNQIKNLNETKNLNIDNALGILASEAKTHENPKALKRIKIIFIKSEEELTNLIMQAKVADALEQISTGTIPKNQVILNVEKLIGEYIADGSPLTEENINALRDASSKAENFPLMLFFQGLLEKQEQITKALKIINDSQNQNADPKQVQLEVNMAIGEYVRDSSISNFHLEALKSASKEAKNTKLQHIFTERLNGNTEITLSFEHNAQASAAPAANKFEVLTETIKTRDATQILEDEVQFIEETIVPLLDNFFKTHKSDKRDEASLNKTTESLVGLLKTIKDLVPKWLFETEKRRTESQEFSKMIDKTQRTMFETEISGSWIKQILLKTSNYFQEHGHSKMANICIACMGSKDYKKFKNLGDKARDVLHNAGKIGSQTTQISQDPNNKSASASASVSAPSPVSTTPPTAKSVPRKEKDRRVDF